MISQSQGNTPNSAFLLTNLSQPCIIIAGSDLWNYVIIVLIGERARSVSADNFIERVAHMKEEHKEEQSRYTIGFVLLALIFLASVPAVTLKSLIVRLGQ